MPISYSVSDDTIKNLNERAQAYGNTLQNILNQMYKKITGQQYTLERMLIGIITDGHVLVESVPGLAKTLMVKTLAQVFGSDSIRIQFTPDLLPADIMGTKIYNNATQSFVTQKGPIFHSFVLADEINRAPPKVQSALLEAMQEGQVSIHGDTHLLDRPFVVFATQNPIESEGTYKLPEAQIDRFAIKIVVEYPTTKEEEVEIMQRNTSGNIKPALAISNTKEALEIQAFCNEIYVDKLILQYIADIIHATRSPSKYDIESLAEMIEYGASPRASIWLVKTARARALLKGRGFVIADDVKALAHDVLRHRIIPTFEAEAQGITPYAMITKILEKISPP